MKHLSLDEIEKKIQALPLLPSVVARLLSLDANQDNYFDEVINLAQEDPAFALHIIKISNGAKDAPVDPILSIREAVVRIGTRNIASLVTSMAVIRVFTPTTNVEKNLWFHAIQVAVTARVIACTTSAFKVNPEHAYLCGLLHDIGRFMLFQKAKEAMNQVENAAWSFPEELVVLERQQYGFNHCELGERICHKWDLPEVLSQVVKHHHDRRLSQAILNDPRSANLISTIQVADLFCAFISSHENALTLAPKLLEDSLNVACIQLACPPAPVNAHTLQTLAKPIWLEASVIIDGLGIGSIEQVTQ